MTAYNANLRTDPPRVRAYDPAYTNMVTPADDIHSIMVNRIAWGAVFAGTIMGLVSQLVLNLCGLAIGAATLASGAASTTTYGGIDIVTALWWTVSGIVASFIGGYTAGRLAGEPRESTASWHGLTSWAFSVLIVTIVMMAGMGTIKNGTLLNTLGLNSAGIAGIAPSNSTVASGTPSSSASTEMAAQSLAQTDGISLDEARARLATQSSANPPALTNAPLPTTADTVALSKAISQGALLSAVALLLGALAAWIGGAFGVVKPEYIPENKVIH